MSGWDAAPASRRWMAAVLKGGVPVISVVVAVAAGSIIIAISGYDPVAAFAALFKGAFGGPRQIGETILRATPLLFAGLSVAWAFRAGLFNIGAEGQLFLGGLAAAWVGVAMTGLPWYLNLPVILIVGALAGAAWAFVPAILKAKVGAHEVITTMMFTYIGRFFVSALISGPLKAPGQIPQTDAIPPESMLPRLHEVLTFLPPSRAHFGFVIAIALAFAAWWALKYTVLGYEVRAVGFNPPASENAGISVPWTTVRALCIAGAFAALAGVSEVIGVHHRLFDQFSTGYGFTGIAVALLAKNHPLGVIASAILFGALSAGAGTMQLEADVPHKVIYIIQAIIIFVVAADALVTWFVKRRQKEATAGAG